MGGVPGRAIDRVDVGILVAMPLEAAAIIERLHEAVAVRAAGLRVSVGRLGKASVAVMATGVGGDAAVRGMRLLIDGHRAARLVVAGLCGGLAPGVERGAIVVADTVGRCPSPAPRSAAADATPTLGKERLSIDPLPAEWDSRSGPDVVHGLLVTSDEVVATAAAKRALHDATGAVAVDMESWWVVVEARRLGLPVHVVRAVCDTARETLPADIASLASAGSPARLAGAAVRLLWNRPSAAVEMAELRERAHVAADAVACRLESMLGE